MIVRRSRNILIFIFTILITFACKKGGSKSEAAINYAELPGSNSPKIEVIYFHKKQRCANCIAVEEVTNNVLKGLDSSKVSFHSYAIGSKETSVLEDTLKIAGPALLLFQGDKKIDLTTSAYLFARIKPEQFRNDLKSAIQDLSNGSVSK